MAKPQRASRWSAVVNEEASKIQYNSKAPAEQAEFKSVWSSYLQKLQKEDNTFVYSYAVTAGLEWRAPETICFQLSSNLADACIQSNKSDIIQYFKDRIDVNDLFMVTEVEIPVEEIAPKAEYVSEQDRLELAKQQNPFLRELIEKLDLK